jgi:hypothetical protein
VPSPYVTAYLITGALTVVFVLVVSLLFQRLASRHTATWEALGSPEFFTKPPPGAAWKLLRFFGKREYRMLNDGVTTVLAITASALFILILLVSLSLQVVFYMHGGRWPAV